MRLKSIGILFFGIILIMGSCATTTVARLTDGEKQEDLSGYWNDNDVQIIADTLVTECVNAPIFVNFIRDNNSFPIVILGKFRNLSDEHMDTSILAKKFEIALINSSRVDFVAEKDNRDQIREEREDQQGWASEETAKSLANEDAADFMLVGSVKTIVDRLDDKTTRSYIVNVELIDVEINRKVWVGENSSIKKAIKRNKVKW